jgi:hypothetical protein
MTVPDHLRSRASGWWFARRVTRGRELASLGLMRATPQTALNVAGRRPRKALNYLPYAACATFILFLVLDYGVNTPSEDQCEMVPLFQAIRLTS